MSKQVTDILGFNAFEIDEFIAGFYFCPIKITNMLTKLINVVRVTKILQITALGYWNPYKAYSHKEKKSELHV